MTDKNNIEISPSVKIDPKELFGVSCEFDIFKFKDKTEHVPEIDQTYIFDPATTLSILAGFSSNRRVLIQGYHGTGKSTHIEQVAARLNWPCIRINLDSHISRIDLIGKDAIILKDNKPSLIVGTPGGSTIITSVLQTILNVYEFDMNVQEAVNAPRFHHQWLPDVVIFEEGIIDKEKDSILKSKSYFVISLPIEVDTGGMSARSSIGAVDAILIDEKGEVSTGADFRGDDYGQILK